MAGRISADDKLLAAIDPIFQPCAGSLTAFVDGIFCFATIPSRDCSLAAWTRSAGAVSKASDNLMGVTNRVKRLIE
jgi:hypothetical protein